jgi:ribosomal protein S18 acetylase RimI-like enzyme
MTPAPRTLERIEEYFDAVPRPACRVEEHGPLSLFVNRGPGWPYYARPRRGCDEGVEARHVHVVRARQRALGVPEAFEWVAELAPGLADAARSAGLRVHRHPLMALDVAVWRPAAAPDGCVVGLLVPEAPDLALVRSVAVVAFGEAGTAVGAMGRTELAATAATMTDASLAELRERLRTGLTVMAAAWDAIGPLATGSHQPVGAVTEVAGVGTLPVARRRGLAAAVTSELVRDALDRGLEVVFLSAADEAVARIYGRLGFRPVATAMIAEPA